MGSDTSQPGLSMRRKVALSLLQMFNPDVLELISGPLIDEPTNAISFTGSAHNRFGEFRVAFERADRNVPNVCFVRAFDALRNPHCHAHP